MSTEPLSPREQRRRQQDALSRTHILDAAERVFGRHGFYAATLREIAQEAEFASGTIYNFFDSKDDLFAQVMERKGRGLLERLEDAVATRGSALEKMHALADAQIEYYATHQDFYRLLLRTAGPAWWTMKAELDETSPDRFRRAIDLETEVFAQGVESGEFRPEDPETMAILFLGIMQAYMTKQLAGVSDGFPDEQFTPDDLHALLDRAFATDTARS